MIGLSKVSIAARSANWVLLEEPGLPEPDGDGGVTAGWTALDPPRLFADIQPATTRALERVFSGAVLAGVNLIITLPFHPGITNKTRVSWTDQYLRDHFANIVGMTDRDSRNSELSLAALEIVEQAMPVSLKIDGLEQLLADLSELPKALGERGSPIVIGHATTAEQQIRDGYPLRGTGELRDSMDLQITVTEAATSAIVRNKSPLAHIFEYGTNTRQTKLGAFRGAMPAGHVFIPIYRRENRLCLAELSGMVEEQGLRVTDVAT